MCVYSRDEHVIVELVFTSHINARLVAACQKSGEEVLQAPIVLNIPFCVDLHFFYCLCAYRERGINETNSSVLNWITTNKN